MVRMTTLAGPVAGLVDDGDLMALEGFTHLIPGVTVDHVLAATGWDLRVAATVAVTPPPTPAELQAAAVDDPGPPDMTAVEA